LCFSGSTQEKSDGVRLKEKLTNFVSENNHNSQYRNSPNSLEEPARKYKASRLGKGLEQPDKKEPQHDVKGRGTAQKNKQSMNDHAHY
jgi:hypothetical protein